MIGAILAFLFFFGCWYKCWQTLHNSFDVKRLATDPVRRSKDREVGTRVVACAHAVILTACGTSYVLGVTDETKLWLVRVVPMPFSCLTFSTVARRGIAIPLIKDVPVGRVATAIGMDRC